MESIHSLLKKYDIQPKRQRGQNFLIDGNILRKIVEATDLSPTDTVVEIGAGLGVLTRELAVRAQRVIAVEIDAVLARVLAEELKEYLNVEIVKEDARALPLTRYGKTNSSYRVIANIPYNITSHLIRKFLEEEPRPSSLLLLVQREVADRMAARPGDHSLLSLSVQLYGDVRLLFPVSRNSFYPKPQVMSAVTSITLKPPAALPTRALRETYFQMIHAGFRARRKLLISNLTFGLGVGRDIVTSVFEEIGISLSARAQDLSVEQWLHISAKLKTHLSKL